MDIGIKLSEDIGTLGASFPLSTELYLPALSALSLSIGIASKEYLLSLFIHHLDCATMEDEYTLVERFVVNLFDASSSRPVLGWFRNHRNEPARYWDDTYLTDEQEALLLDIALPLSKELVSRVTTSFGCWFRCNQTYLPDGTELGFIPVMVMTGTDGYCELRLERFVRCLSTH